VKRSQYHQQSVKRHYGGALRGLSIEKKMRDEGRL
jgi:hypothetical protein